MVNYKSDGFLRVEGYKPDFSEFNLFYKHKGYMLFHTPAEHSFYGKSLYDVELQFFFVNPEGEEAIVSVFFDRE